MENKEEKEAKSALKMFKRIIRMDQLISAGVYPSIEFMMNDEEMGKPSRATIYRTIETMKFELNAPIVFDSERRGYCYATKAFRLPVFYLTEKQMESVSFVEDYVKKLEGTPMYENFMSVLELIKKTAQKNPLDKPYDPYGDLKEYAPVEKVKLDFDVTQHFIVLGDSRAGVEESTWNQIEKAIKEHRCISFDYEWPRAASMHQNRHAVTKVAPYQVVCSGNKWFLWGWNFTKDYFQLFVMDQIFGVELLYDHFRLPAKYDYRECGSGQMHLDVMGVKAFSETFIVKTEKTARELKEEWKTSAVKFSDIDDGKVLAEIVCSESMKKSVIEKFKNTFSEDAISKKRRIGNETVHK